ncbi:MAG: diguanylate cyclase [Alphaproteobacteria bacterium]|nr:diguanylate cyclase [Alphaproteobacteria bacterium]
MTEFESFFRNDLIEASFAAAVESTTAGVVISNSDLTDNPIVYGNPAFEKLSGYEKPEFIGRNCRFLQGADTSPDAVAAIKRSIEEKRSITLRLLNYRKNGSTFWNELTISPVMVSDQGLAGFVGVQRDVTAEIAAQRTLTEKVEILQSTSASLEQARAELLSAANYDALTGLATRRLFDERLSQSLSRSSRTNEPVAIVLMDLDGFKAVNDRFGHAAGDNVLRMAATRMREQVRDCDTLTRLGGDEFVLLVDTGVTAESVQIVSSRIQKVFDRGFDLETNRVKLGISMGVALFPDQCGSPDGLVRLADSRMYEDKRKKHSGDARPFLIEPIPMTTQGIGPTTDF